MRYDLSFSPDGDFILDDSGDFAVSGNQECLREDIEIRVKTSRGDWKSFPMLGADLETLVGRKNTHKIPLVGKEFIERSLTYDSLVSSGRLEVLPFSVRDKILYRINIQGLDDPLTTSLDLYRGITLS